MGELQLVAELLLEAMPQVEDQTGRLRAGDVKPHAACRTLAVDMGDTQGQHFWVEDLAAALSPSCPLTALLSALLLWQAALWQAALWQAWVAALW